MGSREIKDSRAKPLAAAPAMLALLALLAVSLPSTSAGAESKPVVLPAQMTAELALPRAGGFELSIAASAEKSGDVVTVSASDGLFLASVYSVEGSFSTRVLRASYGRMGRVSLRFHPTETRREEPPSVCEGRPTIVSEGFYVGRVRFRGEEGYVEVDTRRAKGALTRSRRMVCDFGAGPALPERASPSASPTGAAGPATGPGAELVATCGGILLSVAGGRVEGERGPREIGEDLSRTTAFSVRAAGPDLDHADCRLGKLSFRRWDLRLPFNARLGDDRARPTLHRQRDLPARGGRQGHAQRLAARSLPRARGQPDRARVRRPS